jgi:hypothetical protein
MHAHAGCRTLTPRTHLQGAGVDAQAQLVGNHKCVGDVVHAPRPRARQQHAVKRKHQEPDPSEAYALRCSDFHTDRCRQIRRNPNEISMVGWLNSCWMGTDEHVG